MPYDAPSRRLKVERRRRRLVRGRIISLVITVAILVALYFWQRAAFGPGLLGRLRGAVRHLGGLAGGVRWSATCRPSGISASIRQGMALRIGRAGRPGRRGVRATGRRSPASTSSRAASAGAHGFGWSTPAGRRRCRWTSSTCSRRPWTRPPGPSPPAATGSICRARHLIVRSLRDPLLTPPSSLGTESVSPRSSSGTCRGSLRSLGLLASSEIPRTVHAMWDGWHASL